MVTTVKAWKAQGGQQEIKVPSGNICLARRLQPEAFLSSGLIPDNLSDIVHKAIRSKKGLPPQTLDDMTKDPKKLIEAMRMMDQVACYIVLQPEVHMPPACKVCDKYHDDNKAHTDAAEPDFHAYDERKRDANKLYVDEVDMNDRIFLFQWAVGGTADVESFRAQLEAGMGGISASKDVARPAKRASRRK